MMNKKGQNDGAMEFLMTYGWAILVVLAAIGALAYFGILGGPLNCACTGCNIDEDSGIIKCCVNATENKENRSCIFEIQSYTIEPLEVEEIESKSNTFGLTEKFC